MFGEGREEVVGHGFVALPVHCVGQEVLGDEGAAGALPGAVRSVVVGGWEAEEVWRVGEGDGRCGRGVCHGGIVCDVLRWGCGIDRSMGPSCCSVMLEDLVDLG